MLMFAFNLPLWVAGVYGFALPIIAALWPSRYRKLADFVWNSHDAIMMPLGIVTLFFPLARVIYCASYAITFIIPPSLNVLDDDGDKTSLRFVVQLSLAIVGSVLAVGALDSLTARKG